MHMIDSNQILHSDKDHQMPFVCGPNTHTLQIQDGGGRHLEKNKKSRYLGNGLTDRYEI